MSVACSIEHPGRWSNSHAFRKELQQRGRLLRLPERLERQLWLHLPLHARRGPSLPKQRRVPRGPQRRAGHGGAHAPRRAVSEVFARLFHLFSMLFSSFPICFSSHFIGSILLTRLFSPYVFHLSLRGAAVAWWASRSPSASPWSCAAAAPRAPPRCWAWRCRSSPCWAWPPS